MSEDKSWDESSEEATFLMSVGLDPRGSVAAQLAAVRLLIARLRLHEGKLERWARSGDFVLDVPGESVKAVIGPDGTVLIVHSDGAHHG